MVKPLFELWDQFLSSPLSRQLILNLRFNNDQWQSFLDPKLINRRHSIACQHVACRMGVDADHDRVPSTSAADIEVDPCILGMRHWSSSDDIVSGSVIPPAAACTDLVTDLREWHSQTSSSRLWQRLSVPIDIAADERETRASLEQMVAQTPPPVTSRRPTPPHLPPTCCDGIHCGTPSSSISPIAESPPCILSAKTSLSSDSSSDKPISWTPRGVPIVSCQIDPPLSPGEGCDDPIPDLTGSLHAGTRHHSHPLSPMSAHMFIDKVRFGSMPERLLLRAFLCLLERKVLSSVNFVRMCLSVAKKPIS